MIIKKLGLLFVLSVSGLLCAAQESAKNQHDTQLQELLQSYTATINQNKRWVDKAYIANILDREMTLEKTLQEHKIISYAFPMSQQTIDALRAHNIDVDAETFHNKHSLLIQHLITKEIIQILNASVQDMQERSDNIPFVEFTEQNCKLAIAAQQLNKQSKIIPALLITDCSYFFRLYTDSIVDAHYNEALDLTASSIGQTLYTYVAFIERLHNAPKTVVSEFVYDLQNIADCLQGIVAEINQDETIVEIQEHAAYEGLVNSLYLCKNIIKNMKQETLTEHVESTQVTILQENMRAALLYLCTSAGNHLSLTSRTLQETLASKFFTASLGFGKRETGEIVAFDESTGELVTTNSCEDKA